TSLGKYSPATGETQIIGAFGYSNTFALTFTPDGQAWTIINGYNSGGNSASIAKVDLDTGAATPVGTRLGFSAISLDSDASRQTYAVGYNDSYLYKIDNETGGATRLGSTSLSLTMDIAFDSNDQLSAIRTDKTVYKLDKETGAQTGFISL